MKLLQLFCICFLRQVTATQKWCNLEPGVVGPCDGEFPRFTFNKKKQECLPFNYGGCQGNQNNFVTREACEKICLPPCDQMSGVIGDCKASLPRFTYDKNQKKCIEFVYGGCLGNKNNFKSEVSCIRKCISLCKQTPTFVGPCKNFTKRYTYDENKDKCVGFKYGGCRGNDNNFLTKEKCEEKCKPDTCDQEPGVAGPCEAATTRYTYIKIKNMCENFTYGGCDGNKNNFGSMKSCEKKCKISDACNETPKVKGTCNDKIPAYSYLHGPCKCVKFKYSGCGGNQNHFPSKQSCISTCKRPCYLQHSVTGPCNKSKRRYTFNQMESKCVSFKYSGCGGNDNNFPRMNACKKKCVRR